MTVSTLWDIICIFRLFCTEFVVSSPLCLSSSAGLGRRKREGQKDKVGREHVEGGYEAGQCVNKIPVHYMKHMDVFGFMMFDQDFIVD